MQFAQWSVKHGSHCLGQSRIEHFHPLRHSMDGPYGLQGFTERGGLQIPCSLAFAFFGYGYEKSQLIPATPALRTLREEGCQKFSMSLGYTAEIQESLA